MTSAPDARRGAAIGIDFGTTNTSIALALPDRTVRLAEFTLFEKASETYRSLLYFERPPSRSALARTAACWTGPAAIEHYLAAEHDGRLIQSLKSFLAVRNLDGTQVFDRKRTVEELIGRILADVRAEASRQFGLDIRSATVGRPVRFVNAESAADDEYAERRLTKALGLAGFESVEFELEPIAAAHQYESTLDHDQLILIGDFGGGTSDFSIVRVGPTVRARGRTPGDLLGNAGVGVAGDAFDAKIIRHLVSPALGSNSHFRSMDKLLPLPAWPYSGLERWHHLSFLKTREVLEQLARIQAQAVEPEQVAALIYLIESDLGYQLHRSVQRTKSALSASHEADFEFRDGSLLLRSPVDRRSFEEWIEPELTQIAACIDGLFASTGVSPADIDAVFLTGGSSFVPAVRRIFETRLGGDRIRSGREFTSVAMGLARRALTSPLQEINP